jgi:ArsR family transcriptional regulator, arsenate/arsenite/antimonite-responsive transcriptional repressor / arsenate reductase (thioredoxin)
MSAERPSAEDLAHRVQVHAALADPYRLEIVDLLALTDASPGDLAERLGIGSNLLAHHVAILEEAGLVERLPSAGDGRRRYLRLLPQVVTEVRSGAAPLIAGAVLFVCTGNSARSQMAAALWNRGSEIPAESAGTRPAVEIHPFAVRAGARAGIDLSGVRPRSVDEVSHRPDLIVTVCDRAHEEMGSFDDGATVLHWSIPDPVDVGAQRAFDESLARLDARIGVLSPRVTRRSRGRRQTRTVKVWS